MFKLLIVSSVLMVVAAKPSLQLLSPEEISIPQLVQPESPPPTEITSPSSTSSSEESAELPASTRETPVSTQSPATPSESSSAPIASADIETRIADPKPQVRTIESLTAEDLDLLTTRVLGSSSISSGQIQHKILPPEAISLPIRITTSPGLRTVIAPETIRIHQPTVTKVGELVQKIPTAVSHQSQTVVHKHAEVITPIVAPAVRTITSQVVRAYHTPLVYAAHAPVIKLIQH